MHHGLQTPFERALSAAIFIPHPDDKAAVDAVLQKKGNSYDAKFVSKCDWVLKRVQ